MKLMSEVPRNSLESSDHEPNEFEPCKQKIWKHIEPVLDQLLTVEERPDPQMILASRHRDDKEEERSDGINLGARK